MELFNEWNTMVFPQAEFEIVPDSQAVSTNDERSESISGFSACSANPKNPDVTNVLRMLSLETTDDTQPDSETLPTASDNDNLNWGFDNRRDDDIYCNSDQGTGNDSDYDYNLQESQDPTITPSHSAVYGPGADTRPLSIDQNQVHGAISAFSARSLSTTISTTVTNNTLPPPPIASVKTPTPETGSGPAPNIIKPARASKRLQVGRATHDQQPQPEAEAVHSPGPIDSEVCSVLAIYLRLINPFLHIILDSTSGCQQTWGTFWKGRRKGTG